MFQPSSVRQKRDPKMEEFRINSESTVVGTVVDKTAQVFPEKITADTLRGETSSTFFPVFLGPYLCGSFQKITTIRWQFSVQHLFSGEVFKNEKRWNATCC